MEESGSDNGYSRKGMALSYLCALIYLVFLKGRMMNQTMHSLAASSKQLNPAIAGAFYMVLAGAVFALVNISLQAVTMQYAMASSSAAFWQYLIALACGAPWVARSGMAALRTDHLALHIIRVAAAAIGVQFWVAGLAHVPIWQAIALIMTSPFFVNAGAGLFLGERIGPARWLATVAGFAGGMIILAPWSDTFIAATFYPVLAAVFWAATSLMTKQLTATESSVKVTLYMLVLLTPINAALAATSGGFAIPGATAVALIVASGLLTSAAQYFITRAYATADAAYVQPFDYLKLPLNVLAG